MWMISFSANQSPMAVPAVRATATVVPIKDNESSRIATNHEEDYDQQNREADRRNSFSDLVLADIASDRAENAGAQHSEPVSSVGPGQASRCLLVCIVPQAKSAMSAARPRVRTMLGMVF
jgi:hypothetical protein